MQFSGEDAIRFDAIHTLLRKNQLQVMGSVFNSQAEVDRAYQQTAELMTRTIPHEAGHAVIGLALEAGDVLEWIAIDRRECWIGIHSETGRCGPLRAPFRRRCACPHRGIGWQRAHATFFRQVPIDAFFRATRILARRSRRFMYLQS